MHTVTSYAGHDVRLLPGEDTPEPVTVACPRCGNPTTLFLLRHFLMCARCWAARNVRVAH